jgi:hypothetical protein
MTDEQLAKNPPPADCIDYDVAKRAARLALLIAQEVVRGDGAPRIIGDPRLVPWEERPEQARAAMTAGVVRTVQALMLLGVIDRGEVS